MKIHRLEKILNLATLPELEMDVFETDWFGNTSEFKVSYALAVDPDSIIFIAAADKIPNLHPDSDAGEFIEGLWKYDVAEIFFGYSDASYHEFNLDANGAFWSQYLVHYRKRSEQHNFNPKMIKTISLPCRGSWKAAIQISNACFKELPSSVHISFILHSNKEIYYSSKPGRSEPDFHNSNCFEAIDLG